METNSYKGWLNSDTFWKRALAIAGYYAVVQIPIAIIVVVLDLILNE